VQPELKLKVVTFDKASMSSPCKRGAGGQTYGRNETALSVEERDMCSTNYEDKTGSRRANDIEALSEQLGSLQINEETSTEEHERTDTEISVAPTTAAAAASENVQAGSPKSMVPDPRWFDGDQSKFED